jgi:hypothetical protein
MMTIERGIEQTHRGKIVLGVKGICGVEKPSNRVFKTIRGTKDIQKQSRGHRKSDRKTKYRKMIFGWKSYNHRKLRHRFQRRERSDKDSRDYKPKKSAIRFGFDKQTADIRFGFASTTKES